MRAARGAAGDLLERSSELDRLTAALNDARDGRGRVVVIEGGLGSGKTSLLREATHRAAVAGCDVLQGRGAELERDFGFGLVRQLFERPLHTAPPERRERLLRGAAALAAPVVGLEPALNGGAPFARLHGIYWLVAEMADERPLALAVDDAHWADPDSLRCLSYVANRLDELPVLLLLTMRPVAGERVLSALPPSADHVELPPLGRHSVAQLVRLRLQADPDDAFTTACHTATAGNPLALDELLRELAEGGVEPSAEAAATLEDRPPRRLARGIVARVKRAGHPAERLARAMALLGDSGDPRVAAELAELEPEAAADATAALVIAGILTGDLPPRFVHPLIRSALYESLAPHARSPAHRSAARLLARAGEVDAGAVHLLAVEPAADGVVVAELSAAAARAVGSGAPEAAVGYLRRALLEPPADEARAAILAQLGGAEAVKGDSASLAHLSEARAVASDPETRAVLAGTLAAALTGFGDADAAIDVAREGLAELDDLGTPFAARLEAAAAALMWQDAKWAQRFEARLPELRRLVDGGGRAARGLSLILGAALAARGETPQALALIEAGLDGGAFLREESVEAIELPQAMNALIWCERSDDALRLGADLLAEAGRRGSLFGVIAGEIQLGLTLLRRGELAEAEAELVHANTLAGEHGAAAPRAFSLAYLAQVRVARGELGGVGEELEEIPDGLVTSALLTLRHARGVVRVARGDRAGGIADLRAAGVLLDQLGTTSPGVLGLGAQLAEALSRDHPDEARALAEDELRRARAAGLVAAEGVAVRVLAMTETGPARLELLEQAVATLEPGFARLEYARALTELGAALRVDGRKRDARALLARALDEAHRCGAHPLAQRARAEAVAAGARPRRPRITGVEALTPSELRVARLASEGLSNREIAQALFVTSKTVADHLAASYRKLGVSRRESLPEALGSTPNG
jgi:DNA-binding CsgD family transcriptional regulator